MFCTQNPMAPYALVTCCIDFINVHDVLSCISSAVPKCMALDVVITNGILMIAIISIASVTSPYFSIMSLGTCVHVMCKCSVGCLVVLQVWPKNVFHSQYILPCNIAVRYHIAFHIPNEIFSTLSPYNVL